MTSVLVVVPAFGQDHLTRAVVADLVRDLQPGQRVVVVDNRGDHRPALEHAAVTVYRPGTNLRWLGTVNWALATAKAAGDAVCVVLNNDVRLSSGYVAALTRTFAECEGVAVASGVYDDFWLHQRARVVPATAAQFEPAAAYREVRFCDGTGIAFSVAVASAIGGLDPVAFPEQGYGADIDYALRARRAGHRCVVTEAGYLHHLRRGTMRGIAEETSERHRREILTGLDGLYGPAWRAEAGLGPGAFPPHNTGSGADWYAAPAFSLLPAGPAPTPG